MPRCRMRYLLLGLILAGCAGSPADRDFRSKVSSVSFGADVAGQFTGSFTFRDPSKDR